MEDKHVRTKAERLEEKLLRVYEALRKRIDDFRQRCEILSPLQAIPLDTVFEIRQSYKEIEEGVETLRETLRTLKDKDHLSVPAEFFTEKTLEEMASIAKRSYSIFEVAQMEMQEKQNAERPDHVSGETLEKPFRWFRSDESQIIFLHYLQQAKEDIPGNPPPPGGGQRREKPPDQSANGQSFTLFICTGDPVMLDELQPQIQLRERDILERTSRDELRGVFRHFREVDPVEVENILHRFMKSGLFRKLKCLLLRMNQKDTLEVNLQEVMERTLRDMAEGEIRALSI